MALFNTTDIIGFLLDHSAKYIFGDLFFSLLALSMFLILLCLSFNLPMEFSAVVLLPIHLAMILYSGQMLIVVGALLIYISLIVGKWILAVALG